MLTIRNMLGDSIPGFITIPVRGLVIRISTLPLTPEMRLLDERGGVVDLTAEAFPGGHTVIPSAENIARAIAFATRRL